MTTIGFIGSGNIGSQLARLAVEHGYDVVMSNSRGPETLADLVAELGEHASAATRDEAAAQGDLVVVTTPLAAIPSIPAAALAGKVVVDTNNYYPQRDGQIEALDDESTTVSELLQDQLPDAHVVKAFNHIMASDLTTAGSPKGTVGRRALIVAGDDPEARKAVADLVDEFGFEPVDIGVLSEGWRIQRDTPGYVKPFDAVGLELAVADAKRYADM
ncbi:NADPH-dependent F420 reductase [Curtobacterium sp. RRHDQ10]|uniref:NADPH-dependent F420 reductase n=1 Tax=Curtobacterium phyllosphaerae TaxID=3413379 RepID=UPI003BF3B51B